MKNQNLYLLLMLLFIVNLKGFSQQPGDTITIQTFDWSMTYGNAWDGTIRDTVIDFPNDTSLTYEKILMVYNLRCRNGVVNQTGGNSVGCGEWDYSCNTYVHDSTLIDSVISFTPSHVISNFTGTTYNYSSSPVYNYIQTIQQNTVVNNVTGEDSVYLGTSNIPSSIVLQPNKNSGKSQFLIKSSELQSAGLTAGNINALALYVSGSGSSANFLRIKMKHTSANVLNPMNPDTSGFTEVYYHNTNFVTGQNKLIFNTPFNWDGSSNIIVELSFTNTITQSAITFEASNVSDSAALYNHNDYFINTNGNEYINVSTNGFNNISNEITVAFWTYGNEKVLPVNTSIIEGFDGNGKRAINIHHPWSNGRIYWDCGGNGSGGYDRIDKAATITEYASQWNHWAFTKNAVTGDMKIYLNGVLWHSGTGKTNPIDIQSLKIAASGNGNINFYYGKINQLSIFSKELSQTEIQDWMKRNIDANHPQYNNLVCYFPFDEGIGSTITDLSVNANTGTLNGNVEWMYNRGDKIKMFFNVTNERPNMKFYTGTYNITVTNDTILDSLLITPNTVKEYTIIPKPNSLNNDSIALISTNQYWEALYYFIYDENMNIIDSIPITIDGTINITDLTYYKRYPMRFELLSFVTPYGIGLNFGANGKTWIFDVTDFTPILKGRKRITVERGGQWQEDMDIKFLYIVGTPPRNVLDIKQIWRNDSKSYTDIMADKCFEPRNVLMNPNATYFKIRSAITGHGQEGEFIPRNHYIDVDGGTDEFVWQVWKECGENPIYPQGGTWIYDRAGWCPGRPTDLNEYDITSMVTPGQIHNLDYGVYTASGTSNYIVNNQLVSYGNANFTLDAAVEDVLEPNSYVEHYRTNSICANPRIVIKNTGTDSLKSLTINYWINNASTPETYSWTGSLGFLEEAIVALPTPSTLWNTVQPSNNEFHVQISNPNGSTDQYTYNNQFTSKFNLPDVIPSNFYIWTITNKAAYETSWTLFDDAGNVIFSRSGMSNQTQYKDTFALPAGCYQLKINDSGDDGLSFFANNDGTGSIRLNKVGGGFTKVLQANFGKELTYNFTIEFPLSYEEIYESKTINIYPNPSKGIFNLELNHIEGNVKVEIYNMLGEQVLNQPFNSSGTQTIKTFDLSNYNSGIYLVKVYCKDKMASYKVIKQ